jgi:hypothetical protein
MEKRIIASDYKGKWFVLQDEDFDDDWADPRPEINVEYVMNEGLYEHVQNCRYYGIPAYLGTDEKLKMRIKEINETIDEVQGKDPLPDHKN